MKKTLRQLIPYSFSLLLLLFSLVVPTKFSVVMPGEMSLVKSSIVIDGVENSTNFYTTSVYSMTDLRPMFRMVLELSSKNDVYPKTKYESTVSNADDRKMGQISKAHSYYSALINAYEAASEVDNTISIDYDIDSLILYYRPRRMKDLEIGDIITKVDGESVNLSNYELLIEKHKQNHLELEIIRNDKVVEVTIEYEVGDYYLTFYPNVKIISSSPQFELPGLDSSTGGPSGGLMQTINIYVSLLKLNFGDLKIGGTGTINFDGTVGKIGGAVQKIHTANRYKMDVFFMAFDNDYQVEDLDKNFDYFAVKNFNEAITFLQQYAK